MAAAARASDATSGVAFNYRFVPAVQYARRLIEDGFLGEVYHVRARYLQDWQVDPGAPWSWRNSAEVAGSGVLGDLGSHSIDLAQFLLGEDVTSVSGHLETFVEERPVAGADGGEGDERETRPVTVDDAYTAQAEFEGGTMGVFEATRFATGHKNANTIELNGSAGSIRFDLERLNELEVLDADDRGFETVLVTEPEDPYLDHWWPPGHVIGWEHTFVHENYEFLSAAAADGAYEPDFERGLAVQRVLDAIARSHEHREWVPVRS
jgi:predicted dehydrogenase